ncbi:P-loop containing nucleoside triphosphate hydrolase protein [Thamnocephalis sphaerospora]|uniref:P-loop containing nucleoside triphosphate hydrolase protein n=1 Tax=Thamnocephalis sphaerospora TaxID=78915 RepID=A0A4P9XUW1_9FUNG|nr:P-loop containing nucleoside triphosphate hydrolase protein [Thamnocephalis sphaerospora]|eukprot:RKP09240.1 P-loop containing nucleoside triphosphate hydrolase protein [Thamnocephalis sphaerospora]
MSPFAETQATALEAAEDTLVTQLQQLSITHETIDAAPVEESVERSSVDEASPLAPLPGLEDVYNGLVELLVYPLRYAGHFEQLGIQAPKGVLLHGPPGVGKTYLVSQVARECKAKLDALTPNRSSLGSGGGQESRVVAQLLTLMDGMQSAARWVVVAATNRPNAIDPALRRPGRFDRELRVDPPSERTRAHILQRLTCGLELAPEISFGNKPIEQIATQTNGYVGADLASLCREAASHAVLRSSAAAPPCENAGTRPTVTAADFEEAMQRVTPSLLRSTQVDVTPTRWEDIGGLDDAKKMLRQAVEWPLKYAASFQRLGLKAPRGVLLYGPPGCSKTTMVKAIASTSGASFFALPGASVYSAYVGESERIVREVFHRARLSAPAVVFLDEVDALVGKRDLGNGGGSSDPVRDRVLTTLLNEMDGVEAADSVLVVGATNRPDMLDAALLRPGRFDRQIYIPPPDVPARLQILQVHTRSIPLDDGVQLEAIAAKTERYSGADMQNICREAAMSALRRARDASAVTAQDFKEALGVVPPSLSHDTLSWYAAYNTRTGVC